MESGFLAKQTLLAFVVTAGFPCWAIWVQESMGNIPIPYQFYLVVMSTDWFGAFVVPMIIFATGWMVHPSRLYARVVKTLYFVLAALYIVVELVAPYLYYETDQDFDALGCLVAFAIVLYGLIALVFEMKVERIKDSISPRHFR